MSRGDAFQLQVNLLSSEGDTLAPTGALSFRSDLPDSISVSVGGRVVAVGGGVAHIAVSWTGDSRTLRDSVTVTSGNMQLAGARASAMR
jgi:hypothetical protein